MGGGSTSETPPGPSILRQSFLFSDSFRWSPTSSLLPPVPRKNDQNWHNSKCDWPGACGELVAFYLAGRSDKLFGWFPIASSVKENMTSTRNFNMGAQAKLWENLWNIIMILIKCLIPIFLLHILQVCCFALILWNYVSNNRWWT
jgi:hypothetical protein